MVSRRRKRNRALLGALVLFLLGNLAFLLPTDLVSYALFAGSAAMLAAGLTRAAGPTEDYTDRPPPGP